MAPKSNKKNTAKKIVKKVLKKTAVKKKAAKKSAFPKDSLALPAEQAAPRSMSKSARPGQPCICIENEQGWFCMKQMPDGELKECRGPFATKEACDKHTC